ncbi:MAG TPA: DNA mismatch repair protein MutL, partial [Anaeromyxobacter sp.]|nr:DNA mismatch repair protein MutL [Anaeromyxobacter sp.]
REVYDALFHAIAGTLRTAPWLAHGRAGAAGNGAPALALASPAGDAAGREETAAVLAWAREAYAPEGSGVLVPPPRLGGGATGTFAFPISDDAGTARPVGYFASLRYVGQHARTYLVCEAPGGTLVVIDQHASHERLLFQRLRAAFQARQLPVQPFLLPQIVTLPSAVARALEGGLAELARLGFDVEPFGGDSFAVKGAPAALAGVDLEALLLDLAGQLELVGSGTAVDEALHDVLATMACHAAVRANQDVAPEEARALLDGLDAIDFKARCPHGRPVVFELPLTELERRVGRR